MELRPGAVIAGKLRLSRPLGEGGMGVVWEARHLALDADVAVKFIRPERIASRPDAHARFEREARTAARIAHPHVVQVTDYGDVAGVPYLVMELLRGASLAQLLERGGRLSLGTAKSLVRQVGSALESAHDHGVVHRDVKPHNVFITEGSKGYPLFVKVLDFGVAKMLGEAQVPGGSGSLTETGTVIGSPHYMSPEQLEGRKDVDLRADLWSLGVIVYEALTGVVPFRGGSFVAVGAAVLNGRYRPASELRPDLPASIDHWFAKALCLDADGRFQSARELVAAFVDQEGPASGHGEESLAALGTIVSASATTETAPAPALGAGAHDATPPDAAPEETLGHQAVVERQGPADPASVGLVPLALGAERGERRTWLAAGGAAAAVALALAAALTRTTPSGACPAGMALIAGATFPMGSGDDAETPTDETPLHDQTVPTFCLDRNEVTVAAYGSCASCGRAPQTVEFEGLTPNGRAFSSQFCNGPERGNHPINCVDWTQARAYCEARGARLPSEAEWELAARGGRGAQFPWGDEPPNAERLNACGVECSRMLSERLRAIGKGAWPAIYDFDDSATTTAAVGTYPLGATTSGVLDLAGNVWEWTDSQYCPYGNVDCGDSRRVLRGGGWDSTETADLRAARRYPGAPSARGRSIGFRCATAP